MLWRDLPSSGEVAWPLLPLQMADSESINCLAFSKDGQFLAASGQDGKVKIWRLRLDVGVYRCRPLHILENAPACVDKLAWRVTSLLSAWGLTCKCGMPIQAI